MSLKRCFDRVGRLSGIMLVLAPIVGIILLIAANSSPYVLALRSGVVAIVMALWWMTEAVPLAVTALLPAALFPILDVMSARDVAPHYYNDTILAMFGTFLIAASMEKWNLHKR